MNVSGSRHTVSHHYRANNTHRGTVHTRTDKTESARHAEVRRSFHADGFDGYKAQGSFDQQVALKSANGSFGTDALGGGGHAAVLQAGARGEGKAFAGPLAVGAEGRIHAEADLAEANGSVGANYGVGSTDLGGKAFVGADANAAGKVALNPLSGDVYAGLHADTFAGAKAGVDLNQTLGPVGADVGGDVEAGIGARFDAGAGFSHGKLSASLDVGAALGIGADIHVGASVDVGSIASSAAHAVTSAPSAVGNFVSSIF